MKKTIKLMVLLSIFLHSIPKSHNIASEYCSNIITHFHFIKCLSEATYFLSCLHKQHYYYKPCNIREKKNYLQIDSTRFFSPIIKACIKKMLLTGTVQPILILLYETIHYLHLQNNLVIHELFLLIFTVYKQILLYECEENPHQLKTLSLSTILEISETINQLPIAELLSAIDMLVTELPPFLEKYEFHSKITWREWFKKYWWIPPIFGGWFGLKILLRLQRHQMYYSQYISPKPTIPLPLQPIVTTDPALLEIMREAK
ncbi:MAG TPA: hypothetical protein VLB80_03790 [Candidatus Babeliales bacterium]|nr:hypothetical protein [Candidatus Babeliales bacterium]